MRSAYFCANPDCGILTVAPQEADGGTINIGVAAHITAASPGGPRYDITLTSDERRGSANGIWVCQNCGKLIDSDVTFFDREKLHRWKQAHEQNVKDTFLGRQAVLDRRRIEMLASSAGMTSAAVENVLEAPKALSEALSFEVEARFRPIHDQIQLTIRITNLGPETQVTSVLLTVGGSKISLDFATAMTPQQASYGSLVDENGAFKLTLNANSEREFTVIARKVSKALPEFRDFWKAEVSLQIADQVICKRCALVSNGLAAKLAANSKLQPLQQWLCDTCGLPILHARDGWLEWRDTPANGIQKHTGFKLVHHLLASPTLEDQGCYSDEDYQNTMHLHHVLAQGISWALSLLGVPEAPELVPPYRTVLDVTEWTILIRRLWVPFYEQGRHYVTQGISDGVVDRDHPFDSQMWEHLVEQYVSEDYAATTPPLMEELGEKDPDRD